MKNIEIGRPKIEDIEEINKFFEIVLRDTFERNGILELVDVFENEIIDKRRCLNQDMESHGKDRFFLIAKVGEKIVGSIEYGPSNELIDTCTKGKLKAVVEIGTVFVHPEYQKQGVGNRMLNAIFKELHRKGIEEFCFDSGYKSAQKVWISKFGKPEYHLKDFWGEGEDHMVWRINVQDVLK